MSLRLLREKMHHMVADDQGEGERKENNRKLHSHEKAIDLSAWWRTSDYIADT